VTWPVKLRVSKKNCLDCRFILLDQKNQRGDTLVFLYLAQKILGREFPGVDNVQMPMSDRFLFHE
jgi:hypothetical protein